MDHEESQGLGEWLFFEVLESGSLAGRLTLGGSFRTTPRCRLYPCSSLSSSRTADRTSVLARPLLQAK